MRRMMADRITPYKVTGRSPYEMLFGIKMRIGCIYITRRSATSVKKQEDIMREFVNKKKKKSNEFYNAKYKAKKHDFHLGAVLVKDKQDGEYIPDAFQIISIKGFSIETKGNTDGNHIIIAFQRLS